jgi:hypothetical protein
MNSRDAAVCIRRIEAVGVAAVVWVAFSIIIGSIECGKGVVGLSSARHSSGQMRV